LRASSEWTHAEIASSAVEADHTDIAAADEGITAIIGFSIVAGAGAETVIEGRIATIDTRTEETAMGVTARSDGTSDAKRDATSLSASQCAKHTTGTMTERSEIRSNNVSRLLVSKRS
jgi:hypothetical protein